MNFLDILYLGLGISELQENAELSPSHSSLPLSLPSHLTSNQYCGHGLRVFVIFYPAVFTTEVHRPKQNRYHKITQE